MKIELKKVKTFTGNEGTGLNAEVWVDGIKTAYVIDDASGSIMYDFTVYNKEKFKELEDYADSLPAEPIIIDGKPYERDGEVVMCEQRIESVIDQAFHEYEQARAMKRLEKKFANHIIWGKKEYDGSYTYQKLKIPLEAVPKNQLQRLVDKLKSEMKPGEVFYNTNFEALNIKV